MAWAAYQGLMKTRPWATNIATAATVMFTGDTLAQAIDACATRQPLAAQHTRGPSPGTSPGASSPTAIEPAAGSSTGLFGPGGFDVCRSVVMVSWNSLLFMPFFLTWFRFIDRRLAAPLVKTIVTALVVTVPINVGALTYSTVAEAFVRSQIPVTPAAHAAAAAATPDGGTWENDPSRTVVPRPPNASETETAAAPVAPTTEPPRHDQPVLVPFHGDAVAADLRRRLQLDIGTLFRSSVMFWVPLNFLNFLVVPPHLRVLPTVFGSVAWNTFLSLTAHQDHGDDRCDDEP